MTGELFGALGFTFLRGEAPLLSPLLWTRTSEAKIFRAREEPKIFASAYRFLLLWTRHSGVTVFPSARGSKNRYPAEGVSPRAWSRRPSACVWRSGYWFTTWRERSDWTRTSEAKIFRAREEPKIFASAYTDHCCSGLEPDGAWSRRPSACVWRTGYWFEPEEQIKQEPPRRSLEGSCFMRSPDWTRTSNPSINSRMLCQLSYGGIFCFRCAVSLATSNNYTGAVWAPQLEMP